MDELKFNVPIPPMEFRELSKTGNPKLDKELDRGNRSVKKDSQRKRESEPHRAIHFMWFHFLRLCLELEGMNYFFQKRIAFFEKRTVPKMLFLIVNKKTEKAWNSSIFFGTIPWLFRTVLCFLGTVPCYFGTVPVISELFYAFLELFRACFELFNYNLNNFNVFWNSSITFWNSSLIIWNGDFSYFLVRRGI